ncbi:glutathione S-transferase family protein [Ruegeria arenilitoris]|uniref:glutathione S-transferase family protein n=1 Tax=Ruegeria arenilitoris TaxID=1173585 RepID=UPI00147FB551|nr:glutathione S-transferase family protein [Ruegeria arenilitoris]
MLKFYYSKGSSALAAHILLEEVRANYQAVEISISDGEHLSEPFLKLNQKGRLPVLETSKGIVTENPAILEYIAAIHRDFGFLPDGAFVQAQARSLCAYLCSTVHVAFAHHKRGKRWADQQSSIRDMKDKAPQNLRECAEFLEATLPLSPWALGSRYSFCDPYLFLLQGWLRGVHESSVGLRRLQAHAKEMCARSATQKVLAEHEIEGF